MVANLPGLDIVIAYACMFFAQTSGADIIGFLWGDEAKAAALVGNDDVSKDAPLEVLCSAYESHHFSGLSNVWHAAGMTLALLSVASAVTGIGR